MKLADKYPDAFWGRKARDRARKDAALMRSKLSKRSKRSKRSERSERSETAQRPNGGGGRGGSGGVDLNGHDQKSQDGGLATPGSVPRARHREAPRQP